MSVTTAAGLVSNYFTLDLAAIYGAIVRESEISDLNLKFAVSGLRRTVLQGDVLLELPSRD